MRARIIQRDKLLELVDELVENHEVIAPKDELSYGQVGSGDEVYLSDRKPVSSLKEFFFPRREVILEYRSAGGQVELTPAPPFAVSRVIIAARPCDVAEHPRGCRQIRCARGTSCTSDGLRRTSASLPAWKKHQSGALKRILLFVMTGLYSDRNVLP